MEQVRSPIDTDLLFEQKKAEFKEYFAANSPLFVAAEKAFRNLLSQLTDSKDFEQPKVISRIKDRDECIKKFSLKYRNEAEKNDHYQIREHISDLIGVRIICLYETDIPKIEQIVRKNFEVLAVTDKTQALLADVTSFGYKGLHFDLRLAGNRFELPEYARFESFRFELQVRSIVQDAWSEVEHKLRYKRQSPPTFQRRIIRLAALFELADQEFSALNEETEKLVLEATSQVVLDKPQAQSVPLDAFSFLAMMTRFHPNYNFEAEAIDGFVDEIKSMDKGFSLAQLQKAVADFRQQVWDYKQFQRKNSININPFTEMRHVLYAFDKDRFGEMLYPNQRDSFAMWLSGDP